MKYRKANGTVYDTLTEGREALCDGQDCADCPLGCENLVKTHAELAAGLMGLEIVQEEPVRETVFRGPEGAAPTIESAIELFCETRYCENCPIFGEIRGADTVPHVTNAKVCGEWAAKNLDRALALTGIEAVEVDTAEMIPSENIKEVRLDEQGTSEENVLEGPEFYRAGHRISGKALAHCRICWELNELYERKNHDYGDSFHQSFVEEGMAMARIRLGDKLSRFKTLTRNGGQQVEDESIRDTLIDLANYAIMTVMEMEEQGT